MSNVKVKIQSRLMQNYWHPTENFKIPVVPLTSAPDLDLDVAVFYPGGDNKIHKVHRNYPSTTGWESIHFENSGFDLQHLYIGSASNPLKIMLAVNHDAQGLHAWIIDQRTVDYRQQEISLGMIPPVRQMVAHCEFDWERIHVYLLCYDSMVYKGVLDRTLQWKDTPQPLPGFAAVQKLFPLIVPNRFPYAVDDDFQLYALGQNHEILALDEQGNFQQISQGLGTECTFIKDAQGNYHAFTNGLDNALWHTTRRNGASPTQWEPWTRMTNPVNLVQMTAVLNSDDEIELYAINKDNYLHFMEQEPNNASGFTNLINLGFQAQHVTATKELKGQVQVYTVDPDGAIHNLYDDPKTSLWSTEQICTQWRPKTSAIQKLSYSTELSFLDADNMPVFGTVEIWTEEKAQIRVNGTTVFVGGLTQAKYTANTNAAGKVTIVSEANSLSTAPLFIRCDFMNNGEVLTVNPFAKAQNRLQNFIDGVQKTFQAVIDTIEHGLKAIESFFVTVGSKLKSFFEWLAYLFDWKDIQLTKEALKHTLITFLEAQKGAANFFKTKIGDGINHLQDSLHEHMNGFAESAVGGKSIFDFQFIGQEDTDKFNQATSVQHNVLHSALVDNLGRMERIQPAYAVLAQSGANDLQAAFQKVKDELDKFANDSQTQSAFSQAQDYFSKLDFSKPDTFLTYGLAGVIKALESAAQLVLAGLHMRTAPFRDEAAVNSYKASCTKEKILHAMGISTSANSTPATVTAGAEQEGVLGKMASDLLWIVGGTLDLTFWNVLDIYNDTLPVKVTVDGKEIEYKEGPSLIDPKASEAEKEKFGRSVDVFTAFTQIIKGAFSCPWFHQGDWAFTLTSFDKMGWLFDWVVTGFDWISIFVSGTRVQGLFSIGPVAATCFGKTV